MRPFLPRYQDGAVLGGSSAGAMVLCSDYYDPYEQKLLKGLDMLPGSCVLPHHNQFGKGWAAQLTQRLPDSILIGIDEATGLLSNPDGSWTVHGAGAVTLYRGGQTEARAERSAVLSVSKDRSVYARGESFIL